MRYNSFTCSTVAESDRVTLAERVEVGIRFAFGPWAHAQRQMGSRAGHGIGSDAMRVPRL